MRWSLDLQLLTTGGSAATMRGSARLCATSEAWIYLTVIRLMLRRLARL
jgi:hypothetical protein